MAFVGENKLERMEFAVKNGSVGGVYGVIASFSFLIASFFD
jgi:hypothetical protein